MLVAKNDVRRATLDTSYDCACGESLDQRAADPAVLPWIEDGARDLGPARIVGDADVAGLTDALPRDLVERHKGLVPLVIDVRRRDQLLRRESIDELAETPKARQRAKAPERDRVVMRILGLDRPDDDPGSVGQGDALTPQRGPRRPRGVAGDPAHLPRAVCRVSRGADVVLERAKLSNQRREFALLGTPQAGHGSATVRHRAVRGQRARPQIQRGELPTG